MGALSNLLPLIILFLVLTVLSVIGFIVYSVVMEVKDNTKQKMEKKNVIFSKDGMKVGVKEVKAEDYADRTQKYGLLILFTPVFGGETTGKLVSAD
jgi:predicted membrane protein